MNASGMVGSNVGMLVVLFCIAFLPKAMATSLPKDLEEIARSVGCSPMDDSYFDRKGIILPPYLYGYPVYPREKETRAVFWCHHEERDKHLLVFVRGGKPYHESCPSIIEIDSGYPLGLSISRESKVPLSQFVYINEPLKQGPADKFTESPILRDGADDLERNFYCYKGKWLYRLLH